MTTALYSATSPENVTDQPTETLPYPLAGADRALADRVDGAAVLTPPGPP
jgi:hypothetical protein